MNFSEKTASMELELHVRLLGLYGYFYLGKILLATVT
jgi:hypothetical protein